jgi:hypothetical protein
VRADAPILGSKERVRVQCVPVRRDGRMIGLLSREEPMTLARRSGELERIYFQTFDRFASMIADGTFPYDVDEIEMESAPRVADGVIVIDAETRVRFASPNAVSASPTSASTTARPGARCSCTCRSPRRWSTMRCRCSCV